MEEERLVSNSIFISLSESCASLIAARSTLRALTALRGSTELLCPLAPGVLAYFFLEAEARVLMPGGGDWCSVLEGDAMLTAALAEAEAKAEVAEEAVVVISASASAVGERVSVANAKAKADVSAAVAVSPTAAATMDKHAALAAAIGGNVLSDTSLPGGVRVRIVDEGGRAVTYISEPFEEAEMEKAGVVNASARSAKTAPAPLPPVSDERALRFIAHLEDFARGKERERERALLGLRPERGATPAAPKPAVTITQPIVVGPVGLVHQRSVVGPVGLVHQRSAPASAPAAVSTPVNEQDAPPPRVSRFMSQRRERQ